MDSLHLRFSDVEVDPACFSVSRAGRPLPLEPKAVTLLLLLIDNRARVVTKDEIVEHLWQDTFVTPNALTRLVAQLRRELGDDAHQARYIQTVHRRGYRFIATIEVVHAAAATSDEVVLDVTAPALIGRLDRELGGRFVRVMVWCLVLIAVGVGAMMRRHVGEAEPTALSRPAALQATASLGLDTDPALSPDGRRLAWSSDASGRSEIYVKDLDSAGSEQRLTDNGMENVEPSWSPDGRRLAYHSRLRRGVWTVPAAGGTPRQISAFGARPAWSPDGGRVAFGSTGRVMAARTQIWSVRGDGTDLAPLTRPGMPDGVHQMPAWSPDGKRLAFVAGTPGAAALWVQNLEGGRLTRVREAHVIAAVAFVDDGTALLWSEASRLSAGRAWRQRLDTGSGQLLGSASPLEEAAGAQVAGLAVGGGRLAWAATKLVTNLWSLPLSEREVAGEPRPLTRTTYRNTFPVFSPDGARIAFQLKRPYADTEVWTIAAEGGEPQPLVPGNPRGFCPHWTPGGERVLAVERTDGGQQFAYLNVRTGRRDAVRAVNREQHPRLSPDGRLVAFHAPVEGTLQVFVAPVIGGPSHQLTHSETDAAYPSWSPDGRRLAVEVRSGEDIHVAVVPATGGPLQQLTSGRGLYWPHSWAPDNDRIALAAERDGAWEVYSLAVSTGRLRQLTSFRVSNGYVRYPAWSPDNSSVAFERAEIRGNIWVAHAP